MKKFILVVVIAVLILLGIFGGILAMEADAAQDYPLKIWKQNENGAYKTFVVVDDDTGVNYVVASISRTGSHECAISICPRYNSDGSLYVSK